MARRPSNRDSRILCNASCMTRWRAMMDDHAGSAASISSHWTRLGYPGRFPGSCHNPIDCGYQGVCPSVVFSRYDHYIILKKRTWENDVMTGVPGMRGTPAWRHVIIMGTLVFQRSHMLLDDCIWLNIVNMGRYRPMTRVPMMAPSMTIMMGSSNDVNCAVVAVTSES